MFAPIPPEPPERLHVSIGKFPFFGDSLQRPENKTTARQGIQSFVASLRQSLKLVPIRGSVRLYVHSSSRLLADESNHVSDEIEQ